MIVWGIISQLLFFFVLMIANCIFLTPVPIDFHWLCTNILLVAV